MLDLEIILDVYCLHGRYAAISALEAYLDEIPEKEIEDRRAKITSELIIMARKEGA
jgi:hypothetical protein